MLRSISRVSAPLSLLMLAACGGGGEDTAPIFDFLDPAATGTVAISSASLDSASRSTDGLTGTINQNTDTFDLGSLTGTINDDRTDVALDGGGLVLFEVGATDFAAFFDANPAGENRTIGVVGKATPTGQMPTTGVVTYNGTATVTVQDDITVYDLTGDATIVASFGDAGSVTTTVDNLAGSQTVGLTAPTNISNAGTVEFMGSDLSGTSFSGGTPTLTSSSIAELSGSQASSLDGAFFGPAADEAGAVFVIDDSADGSVTIFGTLLAD